MHEKALSEYFQIEFTNFRIISLAPLATAMISNELWNYVNLDGMNRCTVCDSFSFNLLVS